MPETLTHDRTTLSGEVRSEPVKTGAQRCGVSAFAHPRTCRRLGVSLRGPRAAIPPVAAARERLRGPGRREMFVACCTERNGRGAMRTRNLVAYTCALLLGLGLAGCGYGSTGESDQPPAPTTVTSASAGLPEKMPDDFGFVLRYGVGAKNVLDTFAGTFTKDMVMDPSVTTDLRLSPEELDRIYRRMVEIGIEDYPRVFRPANPGVWVTPSSSYSLKLRANGRELEISWNDENSSPAPEANALRKLFRDIALMIESREEYKKLPEARGGYA